MSYFIDFTNKAKEDIDFFKKAGKVIILKKISKLIKEIAQNPFDGTGKPEALKYNLSGCWSRRIDKEHRLVYEVFDDFISILSVRGHYV